MTKITCAECGRYFTEDTDLGAHRVGLNDHHPALRRCLTDAEMSEGGWDSVLTLISDEPDSPTCRLYSRLSQADQVSQGTR